MRYILICLLLVSTIGCPHHRRHKPKHDDVTPVVNIEVTATSIHKGSAASRAQLYVSLADAVRDGTVKTVNDCVKFYNPLIVKIEDQYVIDINKLRETRLEEADLNLPANAESVFRQFAREYQEAAK